MVLVASIWLFGELPRFSGGRGAASAAFAVNVMLAALAASRIIATPVPPAAFVLTLSIIVMTAARYRFVHLIERYSHCWSSRIRRCIRPTARGMLTPLWRTLQGDLNRRDRHA